MTGTVSRPADVRRSSSTIVSTAFFVGLVASADGEDGLVLCPWRRCTGGYCPVCGATRAANHLFRGEVRDAWVDHPWVVIAAVQAIVVLAIAAAAEGGARRLRARTLGTWLAVPNLVLLVTIWIVRLVDGSVPRFW